MHDNSDQKMIHRQMKEYRDILYEWNDSYNKNKAKVRLYFGDDIADRFDYIHYFFKETGKSLEDQYYIDPSNRNLDTLGTIGDRVGDLNNIALEINEGMIAKIQKQEVGVFLDASSQDTNKLSLRYNNSPSIINIFGLLFDILGGILLFRYGLPEDVRRNGESYLLLESMDENEMYKAKKYNFYGKIGIASIFLGFVLQLMSNFLW